MDIISHGLWGSIILGRKNKLKFWLAFFFGMLPDIPWFGFMVMMIIFGYLPNPFNIGFHAGFTGGMENIRLLYNIFHSFITFGSVFIILWIIFKKPIWELLGWFFHISLDIFTHSDAYSYGTRFLWPIFKTRFNGIPWVQPKVFITDIILLIVIYFWYFVIRKAMIKNRLAKQQEEKEKPL